MSGRQKTCGSSLAFSAVRFLTRAASHGWDGNPPGRLAPMLIPSLPIGSSLPQVSVSGFCGWAHKVLSVSQMPEKSGLPSGARGVRAVRLGFPSAVFGTPAVGYFNHWAPAVADQVRAEATASAA